MCVCVCVCASATRALAQVNHSTVDGWSSISYRISINGLPYKTCEFSAASSSTSAAGGGVARAHSSPDDGVAFGFGRIHWMSVSHKRQHYHHHHWRGTESRARAGALAIRLIILLLLQYNSQPPAAPPSRRRAEPDRHAIGFMNECSRTHARIYVRPRTA